ncbi:MAG: hypothetical protein U1C56_01440 [Candidatus Curtissbacteria bacterium]|nr:hypothetical protein [bacterium]MDZ4209823.1 hypothetical protein [Candidatus Curtissbacteria bacterium]
MSEIQKSIEPKKENERHVNSVWLFDVDGVLTDPREKKVTESELFDEIIKRLEAGEPVAFNTGRDLGFVQTKVIDELLKRVDKKLLKNLFAVAEKGALWAKFSEDGMESENIDETISVPEEVKQEVRELIKTKYSDCMFFDETKRTMISIEMVHNGDLEEFHIRRSELLKDLENILEEFELQNDYAIDPTVIATDIQSVNVGKNLGAVRFLDWLNSRGIVAEKFFCFGDSKSDLAMAEEIYNQGGKVQFVFVGDKKCVADGVAGFDIICPEDRHGKGTLDFLKNNK